MLYLSAAHKSSGKTTLTLGLCRALANRGLKVQAFKKGPDYIDPIWHGLAARGTSYNLDFHMMREAEITALYARHAAAADIALIEGNKGLYDGMDVEGSNSNAALAKLLGVPVVLVLDCVGMTRGIAPLILGYQAFDPGVKIAGIILNKVGGPRHEGKLREVIARYTQVPVLGAVYKDERLAITERHLGLVPGNEAVEADARIEIMAAIVSAQVDIDRLLEVASSWNPTKQAGMPALQGTDSLLEVASSWNPTKQAGMPALQDTDRLLEVASSRDPSLHKEGRGDLSSLAARQGGANSPTPPFDNGERGLRIAYAHDRAFGFYYQEDLDSLRAAGVELLPVDTLVEVCLPEVDGLLLGGGFPEMFIEELAANVDLRRDIARRIEAGLPVYAECGGLMYLSRSLRWGERQGEMVGMVPGDAVMSDRPVGRGYAELEETAFAPWAPQEKMVPAHEFHYSHLENLPAGPNYAYRVRRGQGMDGRNDGYVYRNLLAAYCHRRGSGEQGWIAPFLEKICTHRALLRNLDPLSKGNQS